MSVKDSAQALAQQPGLQWMGQLSSNPELAGKVNWQQVQEAHEQWNYKQQGLTPAAAAVVAIVAAWVVCIDPLKSCTGVIVEGNDDEHPDGRRYQTLDGQA